MSRIAAEMIKVNPSRFSSHRHRFEQVKQQLRAKSNAFGHSGKVFLNLLEEMENFEQSRLNVAGPLRRNEGTNSGYERTADVVRKHDVSKREPAEETKAETTTKIAKKSKSVAFKTTPDDRPTRLCTAVKTEQATKTEMATEPKMATTKAETNSVTSTETVDDSVSVGKSEKTTATETSTTKPDETPNIDDKKHDSDGKERANVVATLPGTIAATPPDGHCLLHAVRLCLDHLDLSISYGELKLKLAKEAIEYKTFYEPFYTGGNFYQEFKDYVFDKKYNTDMGDIILPMILNALDLSAVVYEKTEDDRFTWTRLEPSREGVRGARSIHLLRSSQELKISGGWKGTQFLLPIEIAHYEAVISGFRPKAEDSERDR